MKDIVKELYNGILDPENTIYEDKGYQTLNERIINIVEKIKNENGEEMFEDVAKLIEISTELSAIETEIAFTHGFKYGARLMKEILSE